MFGRRLTRAQKLLRCVSTACFMASLGGCLPGTDTFSVGPGNEDAGSATGVPRDGGSSHHDGGGSAPNCEVPRTCIEQCEPPFLLTTLNVPGCNGVVLRHSMSSNGACLCDSHSGFFDSEATDAMFIAPDTLLVVGEGHFASRSLETGENRWVHPLDAQVPRTLEPAPDEEQVYVIAGERSEGPVGIHGVGDGAQLRLIDTTLADLTSLIVDHKNRARLIGLSAEGKPRRFDTSTRQTSEYPYYEGDREQPIVQLCSAPTRPGQFLRMAAIHGNNTLSTNIDAWPDDPLEGCTPTPVFRGIAALELAGSRAVITVEDSAGDTGVYLRISRSCSGIVLPSDFPGTTYSVRRTRTQ